MNRARWIGAALALVSVAMFAAFSTTPAVGTGHKFYWNGAGTLGRVMGQAGDPLGTGGARAVTLQSGSNTVAALRVRIYSSSIATDSMDVAPMGSWSGYFARGIDSLNVLVNGNSNQVITVSN